MFLTHNKEARKETEYLGEHVKELIEKVGGQVAQMTHWDERRLAYPIKGVTHGIYYLTYFTGDSATDSRLRAEVRLSNLILRHLTLKLDRLPEGEIETAVELQSRLAISERGPGEAGSGESPGDSSGGPPRAHSAVATPPAKAVATLPAKAAAIDLSDDDDNPGPDDQPDDQNDSGDDEGDKS
jgi:small subunit ribosomal protein S6